MMEEINDKQSDTELIHTVLGGNRDEFRCLVRKYQNQVFAMIRRQVNNNPVAEDLTQETFLRAFKGLKSFDHRASFSTWLIRIALNTTSTYFSSAQYKKQRLTNNYCNASVGNG
ncbi:MAG: sigma-70 family RNA polymerase sigma factor [Deltaproteobacteria bacterium]|nr:sigma-70 family RNA polymerase sigma factor [Deltaproteobacteria bacterium]